MKQKPKHQRAFQSIFAPRSAPVREFAQLTAARSQHFPRPSNDVETFAR
jgi:hypothetical protein